MPFFFLHVIYANRDDKQFFFRKCILNRILKFDKLEVAPNELKR